MGRLARFGDHRFIGVRTEMRVYDCDDSDQYELLSSVVERDSLFESNALQTFGPDTLEEAHNRGFQALSV